MRLSLRVFPLVFLFLGLPARSAAPELPPVNPKARTAFTGVLMWHDVVEKSKEVWFDTTLKELDGQFAEIKRRGLTAVTMEQLADHLEKGAPIAKGAVVLTFDDNNVGLLRYALPLLKRYRYPATFFVHTAFVGITTGKEHCTWDQLKEIEATGLVKVYPHTHSHPADLRLLKDAQILKEATISRQSVEKHLGGSRRFYCYSNGFYDERVARISHQAGYRLAITEDRGSAETSHNLMMVHRYSMHRRAEQALREVAQAKSR
jgi:biofilm PGA synthesis lipoprotein PgaB